MQISSHKIIKKSYDTTVCKSGPRALRLRNTWKSQCVPVPKKTPVENPARRLPEEWEWTIPIWTGYSAGVPSVKLSLSTGEGRYLDLPLVRQNEVVCRIVNNLTHLRAVACVYNGKKTPKTYLAWSESVRRRRRFGELVQYVDSSTRVYSPFWGHRQF